MVWWARSAPGGSKTDSSMKLISYCGIHGDTVNMVLPKQANKDGAGNPDRKDIGDEMVAKISACIC